LKVRRVVANVAAPEPALADKFYRQVLGMNLLMDMNWIRTYGSTAKMTVQVSFMSEGGSGTPVPELSIEVDDVDGAFQAFRNAGFSVEYGPTDEPWGVRRFFVRDPFGRLVNILSHLTAPAAGGSSAERAA
jgi:catechol 2,3-dioxygenase-like lactoylglutathione lyase family enzyme